jgi:hypothetical protein
MGWWLSSRLLWLEIHWFTKVSLSSDRPSRVTNLSGANFRLLIQTQFQILQRAMEVWWLVKAAALLSHPSNSRAKDKLIPMSSMALVIKKQRLHLSREQWEIRRACNNHLKKWIHPWSWTLSSRITWPLKICKSNRQEVAMTITRLSLVEEPIVTSQEAHKEVFITVSKNLMEVV